MTRQDALDLSDYRRSVGELYATIRTTGLGSEAQAAWIKRRNILFGTHPQSPVPAAERPDFAGLAYWPYDPAFCTIGTLQDTESLHFAIAQSGEGVTHFTRVARVAFDLIGTTQSLDLFWLDGYGGGLFLPFRDPTNGDETYGGGRYLLDSVKGADLGTERGDLVLDFNFGFHPSCVYSSQWSCPLAPATSRLDIPVTAGERLKLW